MAHESEVPDKDRDGKPVRASVCELKAKPHISQGKNHRAVFNQVGAHSYLLGKLSADLCCMCTCVIHVHVLYMYMCYMCISSANQLYSKKNNVGVDKGHSI